MICANCKNVFDENSNSFWDEISSGSVKYCKCPNCNKEKIIKYVYDSFYRKPINYDPILDKYKNQYNKVLSEEE